MIDKPKRPKQPSIQDRQPPRTLQELINRYDLDNTKIYDFLDGLVELINTREETVDTDISNLNSSVTNLNNNKVNKSGDTLTGELNFNNKNDYAIFRKTRTINGVDYKANFGIGANQSARIEFEDASENILGNLEVRSDGIYNGKSGNKLLESVINVTTTNTNLNDYKTEGTFYFSPTYIPTNIPAGVNGWLKVLPGNDGTLIVKQIWYRHGTTNSNDYETYVRTFSSNTWSSWRRLITDKSQIEYPGWQSIVLTRSDNDYLYIMLYGSNQLKEGTYSIANDFKIYTYGTTNAELTIPKSAISRILRRDWGFELIINRSGISGIASTQYNGIAVVSNTLIIKST